MVKWWILAIYITLRIFIFHKISGFALAILNIYWSNCIYLFILCIKKDLILHIFFRLHGDVIKDKENTDCQDSNGNYPIVVDVIDNMNCWNQGHQNTYLKVQLLVLVYPTFSYKQSYAYKNPFSKFSHVYYQLIT